KGMTEFVWRSKLLFVVRIYFFATDYHGYIPFLTLQMSYGLQQGFFLSAIRKVFSYGFIHRVWWFKSGLQTHIVILFLTVIFGVTHYKYIKLFRIIIVEEN